MSSPYEYFYQTDPGYDYCTDCGKQYRSDTFHICDKPEKQVGGTHYSDKAIQPIEYIEANNLGIHEANIVKYITRWKDKNGLEDLEKARWYLERLIKITKKGNQ
jgi:hypothetical protein